MNIARRAVLPLQGSLVILFGVLVLFETMSLPGQFRHMASQDPDFAPWRWPVTALAVLAVVCAQVVVVSTWKLLGLVKDDRIFSSASFAWVDAIVAATAAGWTILAGTFLYVGFRADDPGVPLLLFLLTVAGAVVGLVLVVMRALLQQATELRNDLAEVI